MPIDRFVPVPFALGSCLALCLAAAACGSDRGTADDVGSVENALDPPQTCAKTAPAPACTANKYAILLEGQPKPPQCSNDPDYPDQGVMDANMQKMAGALKHLGYQVTEDASYMGFYATIQSLAKKVRCCDEVVFYYTGHSDSKFDLQLNPQVPSSGAVYAAKSVSAADLAKQLAKLKTCHLHVVIDACYSGGFIPALSKALPGLETMETGASATQQEPVVPSGGFSDTMSAALSAENASAPAASTFEDAYAKAIAKDVNATSGKTTPQTYVRPQACACDPDGGAPAYACATGDAGADATSTTRPGE